MATTTENQAAWVGSGDTRVTGEGLQTAPAVAALAGGGYVIAWMVAAGPATAPVPQVHAQQFDAAGAKVGAELIVSQAPAYGTPGVAGLADGGFVVTWDSRLDPAGLTTDYLARRFDANGAAVGPEFAANAVTNPQHAVSAEPTALAGGSFLVEWWANPGGPTSWGPALQLYNPGSTPVGGNTVLGYEADGTPFGSGAYIHSAAIAATGDGGYVTVWSTATPYQPGVGMTDTVFAQLFDGAGRSVAGPVPLLTTSSASIVTHGVEAALLAGSSQLVISTRGLLPDGRSAVTMQRFDTAAQPLGPKDEIVSPYGVLDSKVTALSDGGFVVSWLLAEPEQQTLFAQRYDGSGSKLGAPVLIGSAKALYANFSVTGTAGGGAVFAWDDARMDDGDIYAERFTPSGSSAGDQVPPVVVGFSPPDGVGEVGLTANIQVTFGETIQRGTGSIVLKTAAGAVVEAYDTAASANLTISGNLLTIDPSADLAFGTEYFVEIAAGSVIDLAGNPYGGTSSYNFTTQGGPGGPPASLVLVGTIGNDLLTGGGGNDTISGGGGNDRINGKGGIDTIDGGPGTDTVVIESTFAAVQSYALDNGVLTVSTAGGTQTLSSIERVHLNDALFAFDTNAPAGSDPGGNVWQAAALFRAGLGMIPGRADLSRWAAEADQSQGMGALAQKMIDHYAPGVSSAALVQHLYVQLVHAQPTAETVQGYVDQIGAGQPFPTQGDLVAHAATLALNTDQMVGFTGSIQQLEAGWF